MKTIDFEKLKVWDPVYSITKGEGRVIEIKEGDIYPICVEHQYDTKSYTKEGKDYIKDINPDLYLEPVKIVPENNSEILDLDNVGKLMEVSNNTVVYTKRVVFGKRNGKYLSWFKHENLKDAKEENEVRDWIYAREISHPKEYTLDEINNAINIVHNVFNISINDLKIKK